jgi:hypothetical protein
MAETVDPTAIIAAALESGGMSGLCHEGCLELAVDRLRRARPDLDVNSAWALVRLVDETLHGAGGGK